MTMTGGDSSQDPLGSGIGNVYSILVFELVFYGAYTILFCVYVYLQVQQRGRHRLYQFSLAFLYLLPFTTGVLDVLNVRKLLNIFIHVPYFQTIPNNALQNLSSAHDSENNLNIAQMALFVTAK
ncbi:hypothetical protein J3R30DRAFT_3703918 [Lentinula aciculospora]|uniref:Uncharacterized protein n=1 Tax=Lentinula aciculospora TaxID=153920 RepID=A0A9W9AA83_9AGAR|nr:hypothetical protein J3R30DRAFT_3703918 [Lentinula aciculospora]